MSASGADLPAAVSGASQMPADTLAMSPSVLESSGAVVGNVRIKAGSIFDLDDPEEDKVLFRFANKLHITTRDDVIEQQLLFAEGEPFSAQKIEESARLLRTNRYLQEAYVRPIAVTDGIVDLEVETTDVWTLMPKLNWSRSGGENKGAIGIKEMNLLGTGIGLEAIYKSDVDRDSTSLSYEDKNLGNSWYSLEIYLADNSDGHSAQLEIDKPFYSLDSKSSRGFSFLDNDEVGSFYDLGERQSEYRHEAAAFEASIGWSKGLVDGFSKRWVVGLAKDAHTFSNFERSEYPVGVLPQDRKLLYPFIGLEIVEDKFEKAQNLQQIGRTEDRFLGTRLMARLGLAAEGAGSDRDALIVAATAETGFGTSRRSSLLLASDISARVEGGGVQNLALNGSAKYFKRQSEKRLLYVGLSGSFGQNLDLDQLFMMGGDNGLRGYPLRYQTGDKRAQLTVEQRYFTDWYPFRLFRVGGAVFFDVGKVWGDTAVATTQQGVLRDVGFGLRIGNNRSGLGRMTHIDVAYPLDGDDRINNVQFLVSTRKSF
jgi:outer membrane protein assembly factor BamA